MTFLDLITIVQNYKKLLTVLCKKNIICSVTIKCRIFKVCALWCYSFLLNVTSIKNGKCQTNIKI